MKNIFKLFSILTVVGLVAYSCQESDNAIDFVQDNVHGGGVLRTILVNSSTLNSSDPDSAFSVTVEEQDDKSGELFESVSVYGTFNDLTPDNGTTVIEDVFVKDIPASVFSLGDNGLPVGDIIVTFGDVSSAMSLSPDDYAPGDTFIFRLALNLTDGNSYTDSNTAGTITGGSYFASPFIYNALLLCSPAPGVYTVEMHDSFGDGWQTETPNGGHGITVDIDGEIQEIGMCSPYETLPFDCVEGDGFNATDTITIPEGAQSALWNFPGDNWGEISFEVYGPEGQLLYESGAPGEQGAGAFPVTLCAQ